MANGNTPYSNIFNRFLNKIINDSTFFNKNVTEEEARRIAETRMLYIMDDAIKTIMIDTQYDSPSDFTNKDDTNKIFNFELTLIEEEVLSSTMYVVYIEETTVKMIRELNKLGFSDSEIKIFSPANSLKEFNDTFNSLKQANFNEIKNYKLRDRQTYRKRKYSFNSNGV